MGWEGADQAHIDAPIQSAIKRAHGGGVRSLRRWPGGCGRRSAGDYRGGRRGVPPGKIACPAPGYGGSGLNEDGDMVPIVPWTSGALSCVGVLA